MQADFDLRIFETGLQVTTAIHVAKFVIVELMDLWVIVFGTKSKGRNADAGPDHIF